MQNILFYLTFVLYPYYRSNVHYGRHLILSTLCALFLLPAGAQGRTDSTGMTGFIDSVSVTAARPSVIHTPPVLGDVDLGPANISRLPGLAGSADPMRVLQLMPGIQTTGEMSNGLYVRGTSNGHNLVELGGAHIYNPMHLMGIFSVFNDDNLSSFILHKSYIPPRYGGAIGSVVSAAPLGNIPARFSASGEVGLIASNLMLGIPLGRKSGLYLSGRLSYINPLLKLFASPKNGMRLGYDMFDTGGTWLLEPSGKDRLTVNFYGGNDRLSVDRLYGSKGGIDWGNIAGSAVWERSFEGPHTLTQTASVTRYGNSIDVVHSSITMRMPSSIIDIGYKALTRSRRGGVSWEYGLDYTLHRVRTQYPVFENYFFINDPPAPVTTHEGALFAEAALALSRTVEMRGGLRASILVHGGEGGKGKIYLAPEPRLNVKVRTGARSEVSASAVIGQQYMNQVASSNAGFPTDFWLPSSSLVPPQQAYSFAAGYRRETKDGAWEFSAEIYYKILTNQMESLSGMIGNFNKKYDIHSGIVYGRGRNYGLEVLLNKKYGRLSGWVSYTLGWAQRSFPGIEGGRWFAMAYERRHDLSVTAICRISDRWSVSSGFVFASGNAYTPVLGLYMIAEVPVNEYGPHNSARMPAYHRMDVAVIYEIPSKRLPGRLTFSIYNLYARKNPIAYYAFIELNRERDEVYLERRYSNLYSIIPSVSYSFRF